MHSALLYPSASMLLTGKKLLGFGKVTVLRALDRQARLEQSSLELEFYTLADLTSLTSNRMTYRVCPYPSFIYWFRRQLITAVRREPN
jgi:hypothetical protein